MTRTRLPVPQHAPEPGYRERVRRMFASGTIVPASSGEARVLPRASATPPWPRTLAAAASIAVIGSIAAGAMLARDGTGWRVAGQSGSGTLHVNGRPLSGPLRPDARLSVPDGLTLDLELPGVMRVQVAGGSEFVLPRIPRGGVWRPGRAQLLAGEARFASGPGFAGRRLEIRMPEATAIVTGTVFAALREPGASCVCVLEGTVEMVDREGATARVAAGTRRSRYADARAAQVDTLRAGERMKLEMLREAATIAR